MLSRCTGAGPDCLASIPLGPGGSARPSGWCWPPSVCSCPAGPGRPPTAGERTHRCRGHRGRRSVPVRHFLSSLRLLLRFTVEAPVDARDTAFPTRTFTLPVSHGDPGRRGPCSQGAAAGASSWIAWAGAVLRPAGLDVPWCGRPC